MVVETFQTLQHSAWCIPKRRSHTYDVHEVISSIVFIEIYAECAFFILNLGFIRILWFC
jgi:hypothetical protein